MKKEFTSFLCRVDENKEQTVQTEAAQTHLEMGISCYPSDTNSTQTQDNTTHCHKTSPQSGFEIFCDRRKIDPLTLDKKGQKQIAQDFADYQNRRRRKIGGCKMSKSQAYEDVRDYIEWKKSFLGN